jgi:hypothetical protein
VILESTSQQGLSKEVVDSTPDVPLALQSVPRAMDGPFPQTSGLITSTQTLGETIMRYVKNLIAGLAMVLALGTGVSFAGTDLNEVAALLVYPAVIGVAGQETFMTITNAGPNTVGAHVSFINGDSSSSEYCFECDFTIELTANDTETLVLTSNVTGTGISIESEDGTVSFSCDQPYGFVIVVLEDTFGQALAENYLLGEEVVIDYERGTAWSLPAVPFQGIANNGDR